MSIWFSDKCCFFLFSVSPFRFEVGDWLIASDENTGQIAQLIGTVTSISPESLTLSTDRLVDLYTNVDILFTCINLPYYKSLKAHFWCKLTICDDCMTLWIHTACSLKGQWYCLYIYRKNVGEEMWQLSRSNVQLWQGWQKWAKPIWTEGMYYPVHMRKKSFTTEHYILPSQLHMCLSLIVNFHSKPVISWWK